MSQFRIKISKWILAICCVFLGLAMPFLERSVAAAKIEFTNTIQDQLNNTATAAGGSLKTKLTKQYNDFKTGYAQFAKWDNQISTLHYENEAQVAAVRKQIKEIDAVSISRLEQQVQTAKTKYQPLFDSYSSLNKQVASAKKLKDKTLYKLLSSQADVLKAGVTLARQDIKKKEAALAAAKKTKTEKAKKARSTLSEIDPVKSKIKAEKSSLSGQVKLLSTEWTNFKSAIKKGDSSRASDALARLLTLCTSINKNKQNIYNMEISIKDIIKRSKIQIDR